MNAFIKKSVVFTILLVTLSGVLSSFAPYYWGNRWFAAKMDYLEKENTSLPNTFFFGSSRTYRQVNASLFDTLVNAQNGNSTASFNLGAPATFCPQTYYLLRNFLNSEEAGNCRVIFMELMPVNRISDNLLHQDRTVFWQNMTDTRFVFASLANSKTISKRQKISAVSDYTVSYIESLLHPSAIKQAVLNTSLADSILLGSQKDGFLTLETELETTHNEVVRGNLLARKKSFTTIHSILKARANHSIEAHRSKANHFDKINLQEVLRLIDLCEKRKIDLIFLLPPRIFDTETITLSKHIPKKNLIDFSNAAIYPELFLVENSFDIGHLNSIGATIFTKLLAEKYLALKKDNP